MLPADEWRQAAIPLSESAQSSSPRPLRIAHLIDGPFSAETVSGVQHVVQCLAHGQAETGQSVAVFSSEEGIHDLQHGTESTLRAFGAEPARSYHSVRRGFITRHLNPALIESVLRWQPDLLHFHSVHIPQHVALAVHLRRAGIPYCVTTHGGLFPAALKRGRLKKAVFKVAFERRYLNEARFIHAVSPHEVDAVRHYGVNRPVVVVPNGLPPGALLQPQRPDALFELNPSLRGQHIFMFIGRLDPWQKGLDLLIDAFAAAGLREAALVLVGPDWRGSRRVLETRANRLGILSQLVFTGPAFGEDRANLLAGADMFVHPSRWEGLSLSVLLAAAGGKPCLVTRDADPLGELERVEAGLIVEPTVPSIAEGLKRSAALSGNALQIMGARARRVTEEQFTWPTIARRLVEVYRGTLGAGPARRSG